MPVKDCWAITEIALFVSIIYLWRDCPYSSFALFISVEAGNMARRTSNALALIVALYTRLADSISLLDFRFPYDTSCFNRESKKRKCSIGLISSMNFCIGWIFLLYISKAKSHD